MKLIRATQFFKALADRTRLRILFLLSDRGLTGTQLADILRVPRARVTRHLAYLHRSQLLTVRHQHNEAYYLLRHADEPLHATLTEKVIPALRTVDGSREDLARCRQHMRGIAKQK